MEHNLDSEIVSLCKQIVQYHEDAEYRYQQEAQASAATAGNVTAIEALSSALKERLELSLGRF